ncbi:MAG: SCO family protein [Acidimicrobiales bacterium]
MTDTSRKHCSLVTCLVVTAGVLVGALGLSACSGSSGSGATISQVGGPAETNSHYPGALVFPKAYVKPNVSLTDTDNQPFDIASDTDSKVTLVYFGYTHCPDLCPLNMFTAASAIRAMPAADRGQVKMVFVTTDPARDTPSVIQTWLGHFSPTFTGLTGTIAQIRSAEAAIGMPLSFAEKSPSPGSNYEIVHAGYILVYTGDKAHLEFPAEITVPQESRDLVSLVRDGWQS